MKKFFNSVKSAVQLYVDKEFITSSDTILQELLHSKLNGNMIGISSPVLGAGMFITAIEDILLEGKLSVIVLKRYDITGHFLTTNKLLLNKITAVCPFTSKFENPFLAKVAGDRSTSTDEASMTSQDEVSFT